MFGAEVTQKTFTAVVNLILEGGTGAYLGINYKGLGLMSSFTGSENSAFVRGTVGQTRWKACADGSGGTPGGVASSAEAMYQRGDLSIVGAAQLLLARADPAV